MTVASKLTEPGFLALSIDGVTYELPRQLSPTLTLRQYTFDNGAGKSVLTVPYDGSGLPDQPDQLAFQLDFDLDDNYATLTQQLEVLKATGGVHEFCFWKQVPYSYTAQQGQQVFYLPRKDAYGSGLATIADAVVITKNGTPQTVVYKPAVVATDVVTAGQVWVSQAAAAHPDSGVLGTLFKFGTPLTAGDVVLAIHLPIYRVGVTGLTTNFSMVGREDKSLMLTEVN